MIIISEFFRKIRLAPGYYRRNGFLGLCKVILAKLIVLSKLTVFEAELSKSIPEEKAKIPVTLRTLSLNNGDVDRLVEFWPERFAPPASTPQSIKKLILSRLMAGEVCMIGEYTGNIVFMNWIGLRNAPSFASFARKRGLDVDEALSYNIFCADEYRGNHIMGAAHVEMYKLLKSKGYKKVVTYINPENQASIKVVTRFQAQPVKTLTTLCLLQSIFLYFLSRRVN